MTSDITVVSSTVTAMHPNVSSLKTSNYTITTSDYIVGIGTLTAGITITLPASPTTGDEYVVKDVNGSAGTYALTVSGNGNNIDGASTFKITQNYASFVFLYTGAQWSVILGYAGQQNGNGFGTFTNRPIQGQAGRTYYATDAGMMYYDDGSTWNPIGQTDVCTALKTADFTWQNQNSATSTDYGSGIYLYAPSNGGAQSVRFLYKNVPSTPYTITAKFIHLGGFATSQSMTYGLGWGDGTKIVTCHANTNGTAFNLDVGQYDSVTSYNSDAFTENSQDINDQMEWFRIADDGTNRSFSVSRDGVNFLTLYTTSNTTFLTPTRVGIILNPFSGDEYISCVSWKQS